MTNPSYNKVGVSLFRVMLSLIFVVAGLNHLFRTSYVLLKLQKAPLSTLLLPPGDPSWLIQLAGLALLAGGLALALGYRVRLAAGGLLLALLPITLIVQVGSMEAIGPLFKNIALAGGLLFFIYHPHWGYRLAGRAPGRPVALLLALALTLSAGLLAVPGLPTASAAKPAPALAEPTAKQDNFAILVRKVNHLKVAIRTAEELKQSPEFKVGKFEIVVCGAEVSALKAGGELDSVLAEAQTKGITINACGISLKKFGVAPDSLSATVSTVPNGLFRMYQLQKKGYLSITL